MRTCRFAAAEAVQRLTTAIHGRRFAAALALSMLSTLLVCTPSSQAAADDDDQAFAWQAPIAIERSAAFVELPLDLATYAHLEQPDLGDLRIIDSRGRRVPFAVLPPLRPARPDEAHDGRLYAWPAAGGTSATDAASAGWTVELQDNRVVMRGTAGSTAPTTGSPGWLIDTFDERRRAGDGSVPPTAEARDVEPRTLTFAWQGAGEFTAAYRLDSSDDLKTWRPAGSGQLLSLSSGGDTLAQRAATLTEGRGRFVRLLWRDPASAPRLTGVRVSTPAGGERAEAPGSTGVAFPAGAGASIALGSVPMVGVAVGAADAAPRDTIARVEVAPTPAASIGGSERSGQAARSAVSRSIDFDLGAVLPITDVELLLPEGNWVAPIVVQTRDGVSEPWSERARTVVYRLERGTSGTADNPAFSRSPPIPLGGTARYVRVITDARVAALDAADTRLVAHARLARLVFATQGSPPFAIVAGLPAAPAASTALPVGTLVPSLAVERARFGAARMGAWTEIESTRERRRKERDDAARTAVLRPLLLWAVLIAGVAGLGFMAWRLMRSSDERPEQT